MASERLLQRPIFGGVFGEDGRYAMASMPCVSHGLHSTRYMVLDPRAGAVLSIAEDKVAALANARRLISAGAELAQDESFGWEQLDLGLIESPTPQTPNVTELSTAMVSRRRREIFTKSAGKCHYCADPLTLDGKWHIEHMMPRAMGGSDDTINLVAACVTCNLRKADRSAIEFVSEVASTDGRQANLK